MEGLPSKQQLKQELVALFQRDPEAAERAHRASREGATHEEARPENDEDTRALEQSYLARGQAQRVDELSRFATRRRLGACAIVLAALIGTGAVGVDWYYGDVVGLDSGQGG